MEFSQNNRFLTNWFYSRISSWRIMAKHSSYFYSAMSTLTLLIFYLLKWVSMPTELFILNVFAGLVKKYLVKTSAWGSWPITYQSAACLCYGSLVFLVSWKHGFPRPSFWRREYEWSQFCRFLWCQGRSYLSYASWKSGYCVTSLLWWMAFKDVIIYTENINQHIILILCIF